MLKAIYAQPIQLTASQWLVYIVIYTPAPSCILLPYTGHIQYYEVGSPIPHGWFNPAQRLHLAIFLLKISAEILSKFPLF